MKFSPRDEKKRKKNASKSEYKLAAAIYRIV